MKAYTGIYLVWKSVTYGEFGNIWGNYRRVSLGYQHIRRLTLGYQHIRTVWRMVVYMAVRYRVW